MLDSLSKRVKLLISSAFIPLYISIFSPLIQANPAQVKQANNSASATQQSPLQSFIQKLEQLQSMQAQFVQVTRDAKQQVLQQLEGTLKVAKPGKMHWETQPPYSQQVVSDGELVWVYDHDLEQVTIRNMEQRMQDTPALLLSGNSAEISKNFEVGLERTGIISRYKLMPKDHSQLFERIEFQYAENTLESMRIYDAAGQITDIVFSDIELNPATSASEFTFVVPEGVDVIDARHGR